MNPNPRESYPASCLPKPSLEERPLLSPEQSLELVALFKVLANDTRLRLLHAILRQREMGVMELAEALGMKPQAVSNQLQRLADRGILESRRKGINIFYRIVDPCVIEILDHGLCLSEDAKARMRI
jgi:DNA-binding transcriptional ArsR family regulator